MRDIRWLGGDQIEHCAFEIRLVGGNRQMLFPIAPSFLIKRRCPSPRRVQKSRLGRNRSVRRWLDLRYRW